MEICEGGMNVVQHCKESFSQHKENVFVLFHPKCCVYLAMGIAEYDFSSCVYIELRRKYKI